MPDIYIGELFAELAPYVQNQGPVGDFQPLDSHIFFDIKDDGSLPVDPASIEIRVLGLPVYAALTPLLGYTVVVTPISGGYHFDLTAPAPWAPGAPVTVAVDADDTLMVMPTVEWVFTGTTVGAGPCPLEPLLPVEERMRLPYPTLALETVRRTVVEMVSTSTKIEHRLRGVLLTAYKADFNAVFDDLITVSAKIRAENICKRTRLFAMDATLTPLHATLEQARQDLRALGCSVRYIDAIAARALSSSPQHRVAAACATALMAAVLLLEAGKYNTTTDNRFSATPVPPPTVPPVTPTLDQSLGVELSFAAPLLLQEQRLRTAFTTPGLETLRRGILQLVTGAPLLDQRIRSALLFAYQNDFLPVFTDVLPVDVNILKEVVPKRRKLFTMLADLAVLDSAAAKARLELRQGGLDRSYVELLEVRYLSTSPQHRLTAACAHLFFGALVYPLAAAAPAEPVLLLTEASDFILTEDSEFLEA